MKKLVSIVMSAVMPISMLLTPQVEALAAGENTPSSVQERYEEMTELRKEAIADYKKYADTRADFKYEKRPVYRMLLIEGRNVVSEKGNEFSATEEDDLIFSKVPEQFEDLFEYLTDHNVDMVVETLVVDDQITLTSDYPRFEDVTFIMDKYVPYGKYDSVLTLLPEHEDLGNPCTTIGTGDSFSGAGYGWVPICIDDHESYDPGALENEDCHLYTVDILLHEWMHQLEEFSRIDTGNGNIIMPSADITGLVDTDVIVLSEDGTKFNNGEYEWDNVWPEDTLRGHSTEFYIGCDIVSISYSRAFLNGALYNLKEKRNVGMFPAFWKFFNGKYMIGEFYGYNGNGFETIDNETSEVSYTRYPVYGDNSYVWRMYYDAANDDIGVGNKSFGYGGYSSWLSDHINDVFCRISFNSEGDYYIVNYSNKKYLCVGEYDPHIGAVMLKFSDYKDDDSIRWNISYMGDNFVRITSKTDPNLMFDVNNNRNLDNTLVQLYKETGYPTAQKFQLRLNPDDSYSIFPLLSSMRSLTAKGEKVVISTDTKSAEQKWQIVKAEDLPKPTEPIVTTTKPVTTTGPVTTTTEPVPTTKPVVKMTLRGDANLDGKVTVADAVAVLQFVVNQVKYLLDEQAQANSDIDGFAGITGSDAIVIQKIDAGIE